LSYGSRRQAARALWVGVLSAGAAFIWLWVELILFFVIAGVP